MLFADVKIKQPASKRKAGCFILYALSLLQGIETAKGLYNKQSNKTNSKELANDATLSITLEELNESIDGILEAGEQDHSSNNEGLVGSFGISI